MVEMTSLKGAFIALTFLFVPILTIFAVTFMINTGNNTFLFLVIFLILALVFMSYFSERLIPTKFYPLALVTISISLLLHIQLISPHLLGWDVNSEYYFFKSVSASGYWDSGYPHSYNTALSVTILPSMIHCLLGINGELIFKIIYQIIFSFVPLILYLAFKDHIGSKRAFLASFFFMSYYVYYVEVSSIGKQQIAELFLALLIFLFLKDRMQPAKRGILMIILILAIVISHYSISYIIMFYILLSLLILKIFKMRHKILRVSIVVLFFVITLLWYMFTGGIRAFSSLLNFSADIFLSIYTEFFNPETRPIIALKALGIGITPGLMTYLNIIVYYMIIIFIVVGAIKLWRERKHITISGEFISFTILSLLLLSMSVILPYFSEGLLMSRIFHITLIFLSPVCILGGESVLRTVFILLSKPFFNSRTIFTNRSAQRAHHVRNIILVSIIILYFLFNTGFIREFRDPSLPPVSFSLGFYRWREIDNEVLKTEFYSFYSPEQDIAGATLLSIYVVDLSNILADRTTSYYILPSYGGTSPPHFLGFKPLLYPESRTDDKIIYLSYVNVVEGLATGPYPNQVWHIDKISHILNNKNKIYSNAGSEIFS